MKLFRKVQEKSQCLFSGRFLSNLSLKESNDQLVFSDDCLQISTSVLLSTVAVNRSAPTWLVPSSVVATQGTA